MLTEPGWVDALGQAFLAVRPIRGEAIDCLIDTGFTGELLLPVALAEILLLQITGEQDCVLAGGATMKAYTSLVQIHWMGSRRLARVLLSEGDDQLVGTSLFSGTRLTINYSDGTVVIDKT
jgi:clan AA aspartic protease